MTATTEPMTDEDRKALVVEYLKAFDRAGVTEDGGSILDLFADDAQVYFPKWGVARGREQIGQMFGDVGGTLKAIEHHYDEFNWVFTGGDVLAVEGTSHGEHRDGPWRAGTPSTGPAAGATCSRSATGRSSAASSTSTPTTPARTPSATPGSPRWLTPLPPARVAVLGPGGVGGLLAALLARRGDRVTCLAPPATAAHLAANGLELRSPALGDARVAVEAATRLDHPVDVCFVTVKAAQLGAAVEAVPPRPWATAWWCRSSTASTTSPGCAGATRPTRWWPAPSGSSRPGSARA